MSRQTNTSKRHQLILSKLLTKTIRDRKQLAGCTKELTKPVIDTLQLPATKVLNQKVVKVPRTNYKFKPYKGPSFRAPQERKTMYYYQ